MPVDASLLIPGADDRADPIHHDNECGQKQQGYRKNGAGCRHSIFSPNVKEHATLSAGASVDHGVDVEVTKRHLNRAADRGCVSRLVRLFRLSGLCRHQ